MMKKIVGGLLMTCMALVQAAQRPNIILVLVDDMGWGDLSWNQAADSTVPRIRTPHLRRLADEGAQLLRHYTCAPVCAPARASLFSGVHQGHAEVVRNNSFDAALEDSHTLASVLRTAGYATALIGKWGIGGGVEGGGTPETSPAWPTKRGFDYFFGYHNHIAGHRHYPKEESNADAETHLNAVWDGDLPITEQLDNCYSTDLFTARAKKWIEDSVQEAPGKPFFLALTLTAPHARLALPPAPYPEGGVRWLGTPGRMINTAEGKWDSYICPEYAGAWQEYALARYGAGAEAKLQAARRHATMITRVDDAVGDIMQLCRDLGIDQNTFVVFLSDNGPHDESGAVEQRKDHPAPVQDPSFFRSYGPLDGIKRDAWEGGMRVPCVVWGPGIVKAGVASRVPSQFQDWMATFAELAGVPKPMRCDGVSLLPLLRGDEASQPQSTVYMEYAFGGKMPSYEDFAPNKANRRRGEQQALIFCDDRGRWLKAVRTGIKTGREDFEVYDVDADPHEAHPLVDLPEGLQEMLKARTLHIRRAYDYRRDPAAGMRRSPCTAARPYDELPAPPDEPGETLPGLRMRRLQATPPWTPEFAAMPGAEKAPERIIADPAEIELPAGSVTEFCGYLHVPTDGADWQFYLTLSPVLGSKAYVKMHDFQLIDADASYAPGSVATVSSAANAVEQAPGEQVKGIPLQAGLHRIQITVVQGEQGSGRLLLEWEQRKNAVHPRERVPAASFRYVGSVRQ